MDKPVRSQPAAFDSMAEGYDADFTASGLHRRSTIRLSYLYAADPSPFLRWDARLPQPRGWPHNPPMQWTEPAGKLLVFTSGRGAGSATDRT